MWNSGFCSGILYYDPKSAKLGGVVVRRGAGERGMSYIVSSACPSVKLTLGKERLEEGY